MQSNNPVPVYLSKGIEICIFKKYLCPCFIGTLLPIAEMWKLPN
jgi:hypothetical protein